MTWNHYHCCGNEHITELGDGMGQCPTCGNVYDLEADYDIDDIDPYDMADIPLRDYDDDEPF